jgi:flagellar biosynthesis protein FliP
MLSCCAAPRVSPTHSPILARAILLALSSYQGSHRLIKKGWARLTIILTGLLLITGELEAQTAPSVQNAISPFRLNIGLDNAPDSKDTDVAVKVLFLITILSLAPSIVMLMTCFTRIVIVLSFIRNALTIQGAPTNQILVGLSMFLTYFIMEPVWSQIQNNALQPYMAKEIDSDQAVEAAAKPLRSFMLRQTRPKDVELFVELAKLPGTSVDALPLRVIIPAFVISELRTAFQMGFLIFVPFILIDIVVATVLMSMGMMMMPPATIALPLKILLFVLVDGWHLIIRSILLSFGS